MEGTIGNRDKGVVFHLRGACGGLTRCSSSPEKYGNERAAKPFLCFKKEEEIGREIKGRDRQLSGSEVGG